MKKYTVLMVLFALLLAGCSSSRPEKKSARQELGLRGDVKSVTEYSFLYLLDENGQEQLIPQRFELTESPFDFTVEYTRDGQLQERMVLGSDGSPLVINKYQYQDGKQVMVEVYTEGNDSGVPNFVSVFKYNSEGKEQSISMYNIDSVMMMYQEFGYDKDGNLYDETVFDENKERMSRTFYTYNKKNELVQTSIYDGNSELMTRTTYSYNSRGYEDGYKLFDQEDILVEEERRDLDREGRVKKLKIYGEGGVLEQTLKLSYNETGDVERILVDMVEPKSKLTIEYDYEYDEYGNWDSCLITVQSDDNEDEMTLYIVMRDITYFE